MSTPSKPLLQPRPAFISRHQNSGMTSNTPWMYDLNYGCLAAVQGIQRYTPFSKMAANKLFFCLHVK